MCCATSRCLLIIYVYVYVYVYCIFIFFPSLHITSWMLNIKGVSPQRLALCAMYASLTQHAAYVCDCCELCSVDTLPAVCIRIMSNNVLTWFLVYISSNSKISLDEQYMTVDNYSIVRVLRPKSLCQLLTNGQQSYQDINSCVFIKWNFAIDIDTTMSLYSIISSSVYTLAFPMQMSHL